MFAKSNKKSLRGSKKRERENGRVALNLWVWGKKRGLSKKDRERLWRVSGLHKELPYRAGFGGWSQRKKISIDHSCARGWHQRINCHISYFSGDWWRKRKQDGALLKMAFTQISLSRLVLTCLFLFRDCFACLCFAVVARIWAAFRRVTLGFRVGGREHYIVFITTCCPMTLWSNDDQIPAVQVYTKSWLTQIESYVRK